MGKKNQKQAKRVFRKANIPKVNSGVPECLASLVSPFDVAGAKWPDDTTSNSGTAVSRQYLRQTFTALTATSNTHAGGILMVPHPIIGAINLNETSAGNGILSDLNVLGTTYSQVVIPNRAALLGGADCTIRCTGMGIRVTYEGTELNRSGRIVAGMLSNSGIPGVLPATGTKYSFLSAVTDAGSTAIQASTSLIRTSMTECTEARLSDGVFEAHWVPNGVPQYMTDDTAVTLVAPTYGPSVAGTAANATTVQGVRASPGQQGFQAGQNSLCMFFEGDTTSGAAGNYSNVFDIDLVWHWEIVPGIPNSVPYDLGPSPYLPTELAMVINHMQTQPIGFYASSVNEYDNNESLHGDGNAVVNFGRGGGGQILKRSANILHHPTFKAVTKSLARAIPYVGGYSDMIFKALGY